LPIFAELPPPPPPAPGLSEDEQAKYNTSCVTCHELPSLVPSAPRTHDEAAWEGRLAKGMPALINSVKSGLGNMTPNGGCFNCSDADYIALITYMSGPSS